MNQQPERPVPRQCSTQSTGFKDVIGPSRSARPDRPMAEFPNIDGDSHWFAESEHNLIRLSSNNGIKNGSLVIIVGISKRVVLRFENESSRFNLIFHADRINAMQCFSVPQSGTGFGHMIDYEKSPARLQGIEERSVKRRNVRRPQEGIVQIVVI